MLDEDHESLAAEYVLGTLSADEREHAEALLTFDPGFEAAVRRWERRLGELNVMVEAVEPPAELWPRIRDAIGVGEETPPASDLEFPPVAEEPPLAEGVAGETSEAVEPAVIEPAAARAAPGPAVDVPAAVARAAAKPERSADVIKLSRRARRWRRLTLVTGAIAALLAAYVAVWQVEPDLIPVPLRPKLPDAVAQSGGGRAQQDRLVAVLQQQPTAPAFLLTFDTRQRTLTIRRVAATAETGRSYELWLVSNRYPAPRSLGVIGADDFTERALPRAFDIDTLRTATYAVSLEPAGGSPKGVPTGPILFTGKAVESLPATPPQPAGTSRT